jgi:hypothetical protein
MRRKARDSNLPKLLFPIPVSQNDLWNIGGALKELFYAREQLPRCFVGFQVWHKGSIGFGIGKVLAKELADTGASLIYEGHFATLVAYPVFEEYGTPFWQQHGDIPVDQRSAMGFDESLERHYRRPVVVDQGVIEVKQDRTHSVA